MAIISNMVQMCDRPMAAPGLISYRCKSRFGYVMIGATSVADAMKEASRSTPNPKREDLQIWNGDFYVNVSKK